MSNIIVVTVNGLNFIVTDHKYFSDSESVEILAGYMAEPGEDFYKLLKNKAIRKAVKEAIVAEYVSV